jgi:hypothetical protein
MKQTAVEWLHYHLLHLMQTKEWRSKDLHIEKFDELFMEAMKMERWQIEEAHDIGHYDAFHGKHKRHQYYVETYGGEK